MIDQIEHGHHVFRAYWKNAFLKQYEKFCTFLRNELCSNNLCDFGLKKGLEHLEAVREKFLAITDRFAGLQAQWLNVHVDFPLLQRIGLPITIGSVHYAGIKIHQTRIIRLLEVLLHGGNSLGGWTARHIHQVVLESFQLCEKAYGLNQLRYDLRKLKGHGLLERDGSEGAAHKAIQPPLLPTLQCARVDLQCFSDTSHTCRLQPVNHRCDQHHYQTRIDSPSHETHRLRRSPPPAILCGATKAIASIPSRATTSFTFIIGPMQLPAAISGALLARLPGQVPIDFLQQLV